MVTVVKGFIGWEVRLNGLLVRRFATEAEAEAYAEDLRNS